MTTSITRNDLTAYLDQLLDSAKFKDYGPNGLQVEGRTDISKVVTGVTASLDLIEAAIAANADAILVHHGLFWRGQDGRVVGWMKQRLQRLLQHDINLYAYHLPLDAHPVLGNNAQLGQRLGVQGRPAFGDQLTGFMGQFTEGLSMHELSDRIEKSLNRRPLIVVANHRKIKNLAWCTGGAQSYFEAAIAAGVDAYLTGEISEPQAHLAKETGVSYIACGHHASERYGVQALGHQICEQLGLIHEFIEIDNPA